MTLPQVTPTGQDALAEYHLASALADSAAFQSWTGAASSAAAEEFIWIAEEDEANLVVQPVHVVIGATQINHPLLGVPTLFNTLGTINMLVVAKVPSGQAGEPGDYREPGDARWWFSNMWTPVQDEVQAVAATAGYLAIQQIQRQTGPMFAAFDERVTVGDWITQTFEVLYQ